ncbi:MAG: PIN domain-containing protein [Verrucomicrobia bacterium]|nr:PIN domain-containing protein [Verrucomicrobiota bacterium]
MHLLDVNVLIALLDPAHPHHQPAKAFFKAHSSSGWATCPITENAVLRILGNPNYPNSPGSTEATRILLSSITSLPGHQFWPDAHSLLDARRFPRLPAAAHLTDLYLLALAVSRHARLATFDRALDPTLIPGGPAALHLLS